MIAHSKFADETFKAAIFIGVIEAQEMDAIAGRRLEATKYENASRTSRID